MAWTSKAKYERFSSRRTEVTSRGGGLWFLRTLAMTILLLLALVYGLGARADAVRQVDVAAWIPMTGGSAQPTVAWSEFCERSPAECSINQAEPATIKFDERVWNAIVKINKRVNAVVSPREDIHHWGVIDRWDYPEDGYGDCEDYQILKRRLLVGAGLPRRALRMVVVLDELGQGHAVMAVRTDRGDFILDNKRDAVLPWHQTGYVYIKSEGDQTLAWVALGNDVAATSAISR